MGTLHRPLLPRAGAVTPSAQTRWKNIRFFRSKRKFRPSNICRKRMDSLFRVQRMNDGIGGRFGRGTGGLVCSAGEDVGVDKGPRCPEDGGIIDFPPFFSPSSRLVPGPIRSHTTLSPSSRSQLVHYGAVLSANARPCAACSFRLDRIPLLPLYRTMDSPRIVQSNTSNIVRA
jgi:hypothetical protein